MIIIFFSCSLFAFSALFLLKQQRQREREREREGGEKNKNITESLKRDMAYQAEENRKGK